MKSRLYETSPKLTTRDVADYLGLAVSTLNKMRLSGNGPTFIKLGPRRVVYDLQDVEAWVAARRRKSTSHTTPDSA
ncbi:helix-turn-helix domain-containing protein [uncultured Roseibium sp.]|uniref:helix-turn-helix transcriptional regulator n=1 Tax=uncultured Roseibium sp. TaxID=1936171 RepID=UPI0026019CEA|nr:helix-turn-helix domain-containing protein [uncultured Roseibium sp.]